MAEIQLESLTKVYPDGTEAVTDLDLEVGAGEFVVFVGPSGCGKTTALRMIAGLETITSGDVKIDGQVVNDLPPKDRDIAMVFQNYALYPHMNAYKNMGFALKMRGAPEGRDRPSRPRGGAHPRAHGLAAEEAADAVGRPASARRDGSRDRAQPAGVPHGRAALEPRREAPRRDAGGDRAHPARPRRDDGLRHARPDRGDDDGRPRRRDAERPPPAGRRAAGALRAAAQPLRRGVHRLAGDEPRHRRRRARERRALGALRRAPASPDRDDVRAPSRASTGSRGARSCSGSGPRTWRTPPRSRRRRDDRRLSVVCDIREDMGSEVYVHFNLAAEPVATEEVLEAHVVDAPEDAVTRLAAEQARGSGRPLRRPRSSATTACARARAARSSRSTSTGSTSSTRRPGCGSDAE